MGRKSSAKSQTRPSSSASGDPPEASRRSVTGLLTVVIIVLAAGVGVYVATRPAPIEPAPPAPVTSAPQVPEGPPAMAKFGPHKQDRLPPLPYDPAPARSPDVVRAAYLFAAEHPEITGYVPCYCGCERMGHHGNDDCFVKARDDNGDVTEWEPHGMT
jgi:Protein of unknown function with PCYCGC motif